MITKIIETLFNDILPAIAAVITCIILPLGFIFARLVEHFAPDHSISVEDDNTYYAP